MARLSYPHGVIDEGIDAHRAMMWWHRSARCKGTSRRVVYSRAQLRFERVAIVRIAFFMAAL